MILHAANSRKEPIQLNTTCALVVLNIEWISANKPDYSEVVPHLLKQTGYWY